MGRLIKGPWAFSGTEGQTFVLPNNELEYVAFDVETTGFNKTAQGKFIFAGIVLSIEKDLMGKCIDIGKDGQILIEGHGKLSTH